MAKVENLGDLDPEIAAINAVVTAIRDLDTSTQQNVIDYVTRRFKLGIVSRDESNFASPVDTKPQAGIENREGPETPEVGNGNDSLEGVSPVARKWMSRSGLSAEGLSRLFSLGIDEIDLVAKTIPGKNKKDRMRSVILLKGVAAYLGSGVARVAHKQVKETCLHYDAFDAGNSATYLKELSAEVGGTKESGYTLTARGLTSATDMVKELLNSSAK